MIGDVRDVLKEFETKEFYFGHPKTDYAGSGEFYSIDELTISEFEEKYGDSIDMDRTTLYLRDITKEMNGEIITLIGDTAKNALFTILV
ncbi:hypothetical protein [Methanobacterium formicicum]|uniref:Uncharacterized protein n=1 Tax=Methanobacterium formicicum TaxID=2162 RepID=A0A0S4FQX7_METFO|nr:hypothetical protein [Methanobacterium formicicum]CEL25436.1 hypothetical protein MB9_1806 [Methanobacterium formicicum]